MAIQKRQWAALLWQHVFRFPFPHEVRHHLVAAKADVEHMKVLGAFGGEARSDDQRGHVAHGAEVKGYGTVVLCVGERAVAVAKRVVLKNK